jgi:hypothetical protein
MAFNFSIHDQLVEGLSLLTAEELLRPVRGNPILPERVGSRLIKLGGSDAEVFVDERNLGGAANQESRTTLEPGSETVRGKKK